MRKTLFAVTVALAAAIDASAQAYGVCDVSAAFLRARPSYTSSLETQILMGTVVEITDKDGYWLKVDTPEPYTAWVNNTSIARMTKEGLKEWMDAPKVICLADHSSVREEPRSTSAQVRDLVRGCILRVDGRHEPGFTGVIIPSGLHGWVRTEDVFNYAGWKASRHPDGDSVVKEAMRYKGVPYLWGGASMGGVDCSGLTRMTYLMNGISLPRNASQQQNCGRPVSIEGVLSGHTGHLQKGDLLFFGNKETGRASHVGIYIGEGRMIHASKIVRVNSIVPGTPDAYENAGKLLYIRRILE